MIRELARDCWSDKGVREAIIGLSGLFATFFILTLIVSNIATAAVVMLLQMAIIGAILLAAYIKS